MSDLTELFLIKENPPEEEMQRQKARKARQEAPTQTKTEPDLSAYVRGMNANVQGTKNLPAKEKQANLPELRRANAAVTAQKAANVELPAEAQEKLSFLQRLGLEDPEISDEEAARNAAQITDTVAGVRPRPTETDNLPATIETLPDVINKEVAKRSSVDPDWHQVKNLPGYLKSQIRALGRQVFGSFTSTKIEDIQIIADVGGNGPNSLRELNAVASWLKENGQRDTDGEINFQQSIPDYDADFEIYNAKKFTFMIVKDEYGNYIYSWPTADNKLLK